MGVGPEHADQNDGLCTYSGPTAAIEDPCDQPATMHLLVRARVYGLVSLPACNKHLWIARSSGEVVQQHKFVADCSFPGAVWSQKLNACVLDMGGVDPSETRGVVVPPHWGDQPRGSDLVPDRPLASEGYRKEEATCPS